MKLARYILMLIGAGALVCGPVFGAAEAPAHAEAKPAATETGHTEKPDARSQSAEPKKTLPLEEFDGRNAEIKRPSVKGGKPGALNKLKHPATLPKPPTNQLKHPAVKNGKDVKTAQTAKPASTLPTAANAHTATAKSINAGKSALNEVNNHSALSVHPSTAVAPGSPTGIARHPGPAPAVIGGLAGANKGTASLSGNSIKRRY